MTSFLHDIRYGLRMLIKNPGFTLVAVLTLALGIGANTTIFTLINAVFLHPIAVTDPERVISVFTTDEKNRGPFSNFAPMSQLNYRDYRDSNDVFSGLVLTTFSSISLSGTGDPEQVFGQVVSGNYFDVLGVKPAIGRTFLPEEDSKLGANPVTVLSDALWKRRYGGDTTLVGKTIKLNGLPHTVIGVMPPAFHGENAFGGPAMWIPMAMRETFLTGVFAQYFEERRALLFGVFGRLKPGVSLQQAESSMKTIASRLEKEFPRENEKRSVALVPLPQSIINPNIRNNFVQAGTLLMTIVGLVLLIACANLANLLLVRAAGRQREVAVRLSLGAGRTRIVRQLLTESVLLSIAGCGVGMLFATWGRDVLWANRPPFFGANGAAGFDLSLDWRVLTFTAGISVLTAMLFGLIPALQATRTNLNETLKEGGRAGSGGSRIRLRSVLVVGEVALALVSLIGSGLFLRSLDQAQKIDPGFETKKMMVLSFDLGAQRYTEEQSREFWKRTTERLKGLPMVRGAAVAANAPFQGGFQRTVFRDGADTSDRRGGKLMLTNPVMPGYFEATGIPLLRGRDFTLADTADSQMVAVVNETLARTLWPGEEALGKRFKFFGETWTPIVIGVAKDSKYVTLGEQSQPCVFLTLLQHYSPAVTLHVRTEGDPAAAVGSIRSAVQELDRNLPLVQVNTMTQIMDQSLWAPRMGAGLLGVFGALALVLAAVGIYGVMSYAVTERTHEIGIRMALGASATDVLGMVLRHGLILVAIGITIGLGAGFAGARSLNALLFGTGAADPVTFGSTSAILLLVALLAIVIPARRATKVNPIEALRYE